MFFIMMFVKRKIKGLQETIVGYLEVLFMVYKSGADGKENK